VTKEILKLPSPSINPLTNSSGKGSLLLVILLASTISKTVGSSPSINLFTNISLDSSVPSAPSAPPARCLAEARGSLAEARGSL